MKIICIGDNNVDIYPDLGQVFPGGNCVNVAAYAAQNCAAAAYIGTVGDDGWGGIQTGSLERLGVDVSRVRVRSGRTSSATVRFRAGDRYFEDYDDSIHTANPLALLDDELAFLSGFDVVHTSRYSVLADGELGRIHATGVPISCDFSNDWEEGEIEAVCPLLDYAFFSCDHMDEESVWNLLEQAVRSGAEIAVATQGKNGAYARKGSQRCRQPAYRVTPVDTIGAGDSFIERFLQTWIDLSIPTNLYKAAISRSGAKLPELAAHDSAVMQTALSLAALYAAGNCMKKGAFSEPYDL